MAITDGQTFPPALIAVSMLEELPSSLADPQLQTDTFSIGVFSYTAFVSASWGDSVSMAFLVNGNRLDIVVLLSERRLCNALGYSGECSVLLGF